MPPLDDREFTERLERELPSLASFVRAIGGCRQTADDVLQMTLLELWRIRRTFRRGTDFGAWSRAVARYQILRQRRRAGRDRHILSGESIERVAGAWAAPGDREDGDDRSERRRAALDRCLEALSRAGRELLDRRYRGSTPLRRIAEETGASEAGLKMRLVRLRRKLADCIRARLSEEATVHE